MHSLVTFDAKKVLVFTRTEQQTHRGKTPRNFRNLSENQLLSNISVMNKLLLE